MEHTRDTFRARAHPRHIELWEKLGGSIGEYSYGTVPVLGLGEALALGIGFSIGKYCSFAAGVKIYLCQEHNTDLVTTYPFNRAFIPDWPEAKKIKTHPRSRGPVHIGNDVWLGAEVSVMSGVTIADGAVVGHRAVVTRDIGPYEIWGGVPARKIKCRFPADIIDDLVKTRWWDLPYEHVRPLIPLLMSQDVRQLISEVKIARNQLDASSTSKSDGVVDCNQSRSVDVIG